MQHHVLPSLSLILDYFLLSLCRRVHKIFNAQKLQVARLPDFQIFGIVLFLLAVEMLYNLVWELVSAPYANTVEGEDDYRKECTSDNFWFWVIGTLVIKGGLLLFGAYLSFTTRTGKAYNDNVVIMRSIVIRNPILHMA